MATDIVKRGLLFVLIGALLLVTFLMLKPIIVPIIVGLLLAYIFHPVYKIIRKKIKNENLSTFLLITGIILIIAITLSLLIPVVVEQTFDTYLLLQDINFADAIKDISPSLINDETAISLSRHLNNLLSNLFSSFLNQFTAFIVGIPGFLLKFVVFLFTFFFAVRDAEKLKKYVSGLSPFSYTTEKKFMDEFRDITNAIIYGQVLIGILQGLALGVGLFILGVPKALILTVIAALVSIIPVLGSWLVYLPVGLFLIISGSLFSGIALLLYGTIFVSSIDNFLRPILLSKRSKIPLVIGVIGIIGGLYYFGIIGLVLGPLILAYVLIIVEFYKQGKLNELFKK
ncbi:MAG: AI-2E family transporter [Candidatus Nanoarchaeia archaeon]